MRDFIIIYEESSNFKYTLDSFKKNLGSQENYIIMAEKNADLSMIDEKARLIFYDEEKKISSALNEALDMCKEKVVFIIKSGCYVTSTAVQPLEQCANEEDIIFALPRLNSFFEWQRYDFKNILEDSILKSAKLVAMEGYNERIYSSDADDNFIAINRNSFKAIGGFCEEISSVPVLYKDCLIRGGQQGYNTVVAMDALVYTKEVCDKRVLSGKEAEKIYNNLGFNFNEYDMKKVELLEFIKENPYEDLNILEVGCGAGYTLMLIKNKFKYASVTGLEKEENCKAIAPVFVDIRTGDYLDAVSELKDGTFDYIFCHNILERMENPWEFLRRCKGKLGPAGKLIASISNAGHITVIEEMVNGLFIYKNGGVLDRKNIRFFTLNTMLEMFNNAGYVVNQIGGIRSGGIGEAEAINDVVKLSFINKKLQQPVDISAQLGVLLYNLICTRAGE